MRENEGQKIKNQMRKMLTLKIYDLNIQESYWNFKNNKLFSQLNNKIQEISSIINQ